MPLAPPRLPTWATPPDFPDDAVKTRHARLLYSINLISAVAVALLLLISLIDGRSLGDAFSVLLGLLGLSLFHLWSLRRGYIWQSGVLSLVTGLIAVTFIVASKGTIRAPVASTYMVLVIMGGILFGRGGVLALISLCSLLVLGLVLAELRGWLPPPNYAAPINVTQWALYTTLFGIVGTLTSVALAQLDQALERANQDLAVRQALEAELSASGALFRAVVDNSHDGVLMLNSERQINYVSTSYTQIFGYTQDDLIGRPGAGYIHPDDRPLTTDAFQTVAQTPGLSLSIEYRLRHARGHWVWVETTVTNLLDDPHVQAVVLHTRDISERRRTEAALRASEEMYRHTLEGHVRQRTAELQDLYDSAPTGYHSVDLDGNLTRMNQTELAWLGYTYEELIGRPATTIMTPDSRRSFDEVFPRLYLGGQIDGIELEFVRSDGSTLPVTLSASAAVDDAGQVVSSRSTVLDNTKRKQAEAALRDSEEQLRAIVEASPDAIGVFDMQANVVMMNPAAAQIFGYASPTDMIGKNVMTFCLPDDYLHMAGILQSIFESGVMRNIQFRLLRQDASWFESEFSAAALYDAEHRPRGIIAVTRDITARKQADEIIRLANTEMTRALRVKDEFLANISHELRTPLHSILVMSEILLEQNRGLLNEHQQKWIGSIGTSGQHLLALINDLLDLSKIEAGRLEISLEQVWVDDICLASLQFVRELAIKKGVAVEYHNPQPQAQVRADARCLKQMLVNLLSNAVKFTPPGGRVWLRVVADSAEGYLELAIQDTGIGIRSEDLPRLFQPFTQLDSSRARQYEGTGLGLALVRRLAEQHGGSVQVKSAGVPGQGSCFTIALPYAAADAGARAPAEAGPTVGLADLAAPAARHLLLLAEDNELNIDMTSEYLGYRGYQVLIARTGQEALDMAQARLPDLILMDIQMPGIDGLEVTRRLRGDPRFAATPIIAVTALAMVGDRERCLQAGATEYMTKPLRMRSLDELIRLLLGRVER